MKTEQKHTHLTNKAKQAKITKTVLENWPTLMEKMRLYKIISNISKNTQGLMAVKTEKRKLPKHSPMGQRLPKK
jgi:hypothetical protein